MVRISKQDLTSDIAQVGNNIDGIQRAINFERTHSKYPKRNAYCNFYFKNHDCYQITLPKGIIMSKHCLAKHLSRDISGTLAGMSVKGLWLDGASSKKELLDALPITTEHYYWVTMKHHSIHSVNTVIGCHLVSLGENEWFALTQKRRLIENLKLILSRLHLNNSHIVKAMNRLIYLMKGRNGLGKYFQVVIRKHQYANRFFIKIVNRSQATLLLKDNRDAYHLNKLNHSSNTFFMVTNNGLKPLDLKLARKYVKVALYDLRHNK